MKALTDQRLGAVSASEMDRVFYCDGYLGLKKQVEAQRVIPVDKGESAAASQGTELHALNESGDVSEVAYSDAEIVIEIRNREEQLVREWAVDMNIPFEEIKLIRERRFWFDNGLASAQVDLLAYWDEFAYVLDSKTGRLPVPPPVRNHQLRTCAACVVSELGFKHVRCAIVNVFGALKPPVDYPNEDLNRIAINIRARLKETKEPGLPLTAGPHCLYCPNAHVCEPRRDQMALVIQKRSLNWDLVTPDMRKPLFLSAKMAVAAGTAILQQLKADLEADPECAPGLIKRKDGTTRKITDTKEAYLALERIDVCEPSVAINKFLDVASISIENFTTLYRDMTGASKVEAEAFLEKKCAGFIEKNPRSGSVSVKEEK